jgi:hypothetical protein
VTQTPSPTDDKTDELVREGFLEEGAARIERDVASGME